MSWLAPRRHCGAVCCGQWVLCWQRQLSEAPGGAAATGGAAPGHSNQSQLKCDVTPVGAEEVVRGLKASFEEIYNVNIGKTVRTVTTEQVKAITVMFPVNKTCCFCSLGSTTDMEVHGHMEVHHQQLLELDTDHLYRHLTEVNGKDTRVRTT